MNKKVNASIVLFAVLLIISSSVTRSQTVLLDVETRADSVETNFGLNKTHYLNFYFGYGAIVGPSTTGAAIIYLGSGGSDIGLRYKLKLGETFSTGVDLSYESPTYKLKQNTTKVLPDGIIHEEESFEYNTLAAGPYLRINFGKRGNYIGKYVDLAGRFHLVIKAQHYAKDEQPNGNITRIYTSKLNYTHPSYYDALVRVGNNRYAIKVSYRLTDLFTTASALPELPQLMIGIEVGAHK